MTPLAAFLRLTGGSCQEGNQIYVFFADVNDSLALGTFTSTEGWSSSGCASPYMDFSQLSHFTMSRQTQALSAAVLHETEGTEENPIPNFGVLLMLYDSNESPLLLYGIERRTQLDSSSFTISLVWTNITQQLYTALKTDFLSSSNFTFSNFVYEKNNTALWGTLGLLQTNDASNSGAGTTIQQLYVAGNQNATVGKCKSSKSLGYVRPTNV